MVDCRPDAGRNMAWVSPSCRPHQVGLGEGLAFFFSFFFENKICRRTHSLLFWFSLLALHSSSVNLSSMETQERGLLL